MKNLWLVLAILISTIRLSAQINPAARLAIISESPGASAAADVLTAELSSHKNLQLLERNEIERVYHEQGMLAGNKDYLKLGQILGADGLLLLETAKEGTNQFLNIRLVAVTPGVVLVAEQLSWPIKNLTEWSPGFVKHLDSFLPKLTVLVKDAIPISVVNLRSSISSADSLETERQLKLLTIQRLSRERQLFVLERQRMQLLGGEKELKLDDSAFWNGSYLLEGVVDQNGFSQETITVNARLIPPKGGTSQQFAVSGSRTNLVEVINQLTAKVNEVLMLNSTANEWNAGDEAVQYFAEAQWALGWGVLSEAQMAADSAWALGKRDMDCAMIRIRAYKGSLKTINIGEQGSIDSSLVDSTKQADRDHLTRLMKNISTAHGVVIFETNRTGIGYICFNESPDPQIVGQAIHVLELYYNFTRTSPEGAPKLFSLRDRSSSNNSAWYQLGMDCLMACSKVLQDFNFVPEAQKPVADKLAELRALTRSVAKLFSETPAERDGYFVGDRFVTHDELANTIAERPNIFSCELTWGALWQETPEDCLALYRELMSSPVFCYIHSTFWAHRVQSPQIVNAIDHNLEPARLVAWNETDRQHIPSLWRAFVRELDNSTNVFLQLEAKAIHFADADDEKKMGETFANFFDALFTNRDALVSNQVEVLYLNWGADALVGVTRGMGSDPVSTPDALRRKFYSEYRPRLEAMDREYWDKTVPAQRTTAAFAKQKQFLMENKPFDFFEFVKMFEEKNYSQAQAEEILPLLAAYKSNLVAQSQNASAKQKGQLMGATHQVGFLEADVNLILSPPAPKLQPPAQTQIPKSSPVAKAAAVPPASIGSQEIVTNILVVNKFLEIPMDGLIRLNGLEAIDHSRITITAHHLLEGKLLLNFEYQLLSNQYGAAYGSGIAMLDLATEHWDVISCPKEEIQSQNNCYDRSTLLRGVLFNCDGGKIQKYDFQSQTWQVLPVSDGNNYELFAINGHLYVAGRDIIFEILDGGKSTRILASTRRQPPVSTLDREDLGMPVLFEGPAHSLRVSTKNKIYTWAGEDWREDFATPPASFPPVISTDGVLFRTDGFNLPVSISSLTMETNAVEFLLGNKTRPVNNPGYYRPSANKPLEPQPLWKLPAELSLANLPAALRYSDLYLLLDHCDLQKIVNDQHELVKEKVIAKDDYNAELLCFSRGLPLPVKIFLKFDAPEGCPPITGINPNSRQIFSGMLPPWMFFATNVVFCGLEKQKGYGMDFLPDSTRDVGIGYKAGVWMIPRAQLESAIAEQKQIQRKQMDKRVSAEKETKKNLLIKYDLNHNGIINPEEREAALENTVFLESELGLIDANHNGWLDAIELVYFDANTNKILEPKEQAGIELAQHLLAENLLKKFDANGDGSLDRPEFNESFQSIMATSIRSMPALANIPSLFRDENHDGHVDLGELETFLKQQTRNGLRPRGMSGTTVLNRMRTDGNQPVDVSQIFKLTVEAYWQNPSGVINRPPFRNVTPPGGMQTIPNP